MLCHRGFELLSPYLTQKIDLSMIGKKPTKELGTAGKLMVYGFHGSCPPFRRKEPNFITDKRVISDYRLITNQLKERQVFDYRARRKHDEKPHLDKLVIVGNQ
jgi:hypothetical protein